MRKPYVKRWLRIAASLALLLGMLHLLSLEELGFALRRVSIAALLFALATMLLNFAVMGVRWYRLIQPCAPMRLVDHLQRYCYATFLNTFTPANVGGDVYRVISLRAHAPRTAAVIAVVLRERLLGLLSYLLAYILMLSCVRLDPLVVKPAAVSLFAYAGIVAAGTAAAIFLVPYALTGPIMRLPAVGRRRRLAAVVEVLDQAGRFGSFRELVILLGLSFVGIALWVSAVQVIAVDVGLTVSWIELGVVAVLTELLRMLPITIQGIGLREALFSYLLASLGRSPESGFAVGLVSYLVLTCALVVSGLVGWALLHFKPTERT
jgi:hypothetical protein